MLCPKCDTDNSISATRCIKCQEELDFFGLTNNTSNNPAETATLTQSSPTPDPQIENLNTPDNSKVCPKCGTGNSPDAIFCNLCHTRFDGSGSSLAGSNPTEPSTYETNEDMYQSIAGSFTSVKITNYAGFWTRFFAYLIDGFIYFVIFIVIFLFLFFIFGQSIFLSKNNPVINSLINGLIILGAIFSWLYYTLMESSAYQATIGKSAMGIKVTDIDGNRISFARANGRFWAKIISNIIPFGLAYIVAAFTEKKQTLHDIIAKTLVVKK